MFALSYRVFLCCVQRRWLR